jgi:TonB-linked SusC/RagA family outer membrane protein
MVPMTRLNTRRSIPLGVVLTLLAGLLVLPAAAHAQGAVITGRVQSEMGQPLEAANVFITEMNVSVGTNAQGRYTITLPAERVRGQSVVLRVRAIGFIAKATPLTLTAGNHTSDFELARDINRLQEVVVTGQTAATSQAKTTFTVTALSAETDMPVTGNSALAGLAGKVTGMSVVSSGGRPGTAPSIVLRGPKSINSNASRLPLILVDGVILNTRTNDLLGDINPDDIESVEVVKGAAASSLYGSRAGNGVIQITTKSAKNAAPGIRINARQATGYDEVVGTYPFAKRHMLLMSAGNDRFCIKVTGLPSCSRTVDWDQEVARINEVDGPVTATPYIFERDYGIGAAASKPELKGLFMSNQWPTMYDPVQMMATPHLNSTTTLDLTGKFGTTGYFTSFQNFKEQGAIKYLLGYNRQSARLNVDQQIGGNFTTQMQTYYMRSQNYPEVSTNSWFSITREHPSANLNARDSKGRLYYRPDATSETSQDANTNPLYWNSCCYDVITGDRFLGSLSSRYSPFSWLDVDATANMDNRRDEEVSLNDKGNVRRTAPAPATDGSISTGNTKDLSYNTALGATARRNFGRDLASRVNLRYTYEQQDADSTSGTGSVLALPGLLTLSNATTSKNATFSQRSQRAIGGSAGLNLEYKERYIFDGLFRKDGSSLFGANERWHDYYRASFAWRASDEPWWRFTNTVNDLKVRGSVGTAGGRPTFAAQYEALTIGTGGSITANTLGNKDLKPQTTIETEYGIDAELFHKYGLSVTYARDITYDEILQVPPSVSSGFSSQWQNAGTMDGKTWEASLNIPILTKRSLVWTGRLNWDQNRSKITSMNIPDFFSGNIFYGVGARWGDVYGKKFVTQCSELPAQFEAMCGDGKDWQKNDDGYIVWVGAGNSPKDGVTKNLWQAVRPGCIVNGAARADLDGEVLCRRAGGTVNNPWGQRAVHWGMLQVIRDSTSSPRLLNIGNAAPLWHATFAQTFTYKKLNLYALLDRSFGNRVYNESRAWSFGDFMVDEQEATGKTVESAKPIGYYWRAPSPDNAAGVGGYYDVLGPNIINFEDCSYLKLREFSAGYNFGRVANVLGDWTVSAVGKNLFTKSKFRGWDPDQGNGATASQTASTYPLIRTFLITVSSKF